MALRVVDLFFRARLASADHRLRYLGPTMRGLFGHALKRTVCQVPGGECPRCPLRQRCPYPMIFEGRAPEGRTIMRKYPTVPQPFVLLVAAPGAWWGGPTDLHWGMRLFGDAAQLTPDVIQTFVRAGPDGVGPWRVPYELLQVEEGAGGPVLWNVDDVEPRVPAPRNVDQRAPPVDGALRWRFHTPLHLREGGRLCGDIDGLALMLAGRRRAMLLEAFYGDGGANDSDGRDEYLDARAFVTREAHVRRWEIGRFSGRQRRPVLLAGELGELVIEGPWSRVGAWIRSVADLHLGKYETFGFGRVTWEPA